MTEEEFVELVLKKLPTGTKIIKIERDGNTFFEAGKLNIDRTARLLRDLIK